jgi:hypothetical protein
MFLEQLQSVLGVAGGKDPELIFESAGEILQRLLLVIDVENRELLIVV